VEVQAEVVTVVVGVVVVVVIGVAVVELVQILVLLAAVVLVILTLVILQVELPLKVVVLPVVVQGQKERMEMQRWFIFKFIYNKKQIVESI
jgi:hypothetical protein